MAYLSCLQNKSSTGLLENENQNNYKPFIMMTFDHCSVFYISLSQDSGHHSLESHNRHRRNETTPVTLSPCTTTYTASLPPNPLYHHHEYDPTPHDPTPHDPTPHDPTPHDPTPHDPTPLATHHNHATNTPTAYAQRLRQAQQATHNNNNKSEVDKPTTLTYTLAGPVLQPSLSDTPSPIPPLPPPRNYNSQYSVKYPLRNSQPLHMGYKTR